MYKTFSLLVLTMTLSGCATSLLSTALPNESSQVQTTTLKTDQILALGQAIQNEKSQGLIFIGQDFNYLMTDGSTELLKLLHAIPAEQRSFHPSPLVLTMDDPNHFRGVLKMRYHTRMVDLNSKQKELLKSLGFRQNFDLIQNQETAPYPYINVFFKGQLYQALDQQKIQQKLAQPYPISLQQQTTITTKHPVKRATRMVLYPLAMVFDVVTVTPLLMWSDLRGDFNK
ncbi:hypothetical protein MN869_16295 [Acinetobacter sp. NIPH1876]|uniref:hypothetical protein n=1 Tax=unclassified Acinetobacter TaxID=196816 RepID=UPI001FAC5A07|nr:hypothetical protein [Acinetobacter sp. NIPH1876]MCJ0830004.1 hypothetical protein [Acinetobacter sp. NIPH1876]